MSQLVNLNNRVINLFSIATLIAIFVVGSTGCGNDGHDHSEHNHSNHSKNGDDVNTHDKSTASQKNYPTDLCVVSGEKLGSMGEPIVIKHEGREVRLCCKGCVKDFNGDPKKYLAKLDAPKQP